MYEVTPDPPGSGGEFLFDVSPPLSQAWYLSGSVSDPVGPQFPFVANWWYGVPTGRLKMATFHSIAVLRRGSVRVYSRRDSLVGRLIGETLSQLVIIQV
jgi:hypothetical protein